MRSREIILASSSPRRSELLKRLGVKFRVVAPDGVDEVLMGFDPQELVITNAQRKARAVAAANPQALVIGADTVVILGSRVYGKPIDRDEAFEMLQSLQGREHRVLTGVSVICEATTFDTCFCESTFVTMRSLNVDEIITYIDKVDPLDKAGAYAIQCREGSIISKFEGCYDNVVGLPTKRLGRTLQELGVMESRYRVEHSYYVLCDESRTASFVHSNISVISTPRQWIRMLVFS